MSITHYRREGICNIHCLTVSNQTEAGNSDFPLAQLLAHTRCNNLQHSTVTYVKDNKVVNTIDPNLNPKNSYKTKRNLD